MDYLIDISTQLIYMNMISLLRHKIQLYYQKAHGMKQFRLHILTKVSAVMSFPIDSSWLPQVDVTDKVMLFPCPKWEGRHNGN